MKTIVLRYNSTKFVITTNKKEIGAIVKVDGKFYEVENKAAEKLAQKLYMEGARIVRGSILSFAPI